MPAIMFEFRLYSAYKYRNSKVYQDLKSLRIHFKMKRAYVLYYSNGK